jgi:murein DD-endopeptidase MepM/ murein hydrolase activator NlpD
MPKKIIFLCLIFSIIFFSAPVTAQENTDLPVYIVQSGDTLTLIAIKFGVSLNSILEANAIANPNALNVGDRLVIPGLDGIRGTLVLKTVPLGETLTSVSSKYQFPLNFLTRLNRITSPNEIYAGVELILPQPQENSILLPTIMLANGQSLLEAAVAVDLNPWLLQETNHLSGTWDILSGESLYTAIKDGGLSEGAIGPYISELQIEPLPLIQGRTTTITVKTTQPVTLKGTLAGQELHFFELDAGHYIALAGISAIQETGLSDISLQLTPSSGSPFDIQQMIFLSPGLFTNESVVGVNASTIDPDVILQEDKTLADLQMITPVRHWTGTFKWPVDEPCPSSRFGNRRSYNSGQYFYFHTGLDFTVCAQNLNIYATAPGTVIFNGPLEIKGVYTVIDHGWGVFSGYAHQAESYVNSGDFVEAGQLIGIIGNTGRSVGPHLHWEIWVNGIQVDPLDWVSNMYP